MKHFFTACMLLTVVACGSTKLIATDPSKVPPVNAPETEPAVPSGPEGLKAPMPPAETKFTSAGRMGALMNFLAADELKGRDSGSEGIEKAAQYLEKQLETFGIPPYYPTYRDTLSNFKKPAYNIVGFLQGSDPDLSKEFIIIGAHYDHIGVVKPENGDSIANGANDNASGTATVLELARYFANEKSNRRSLIFALFSAEENGLLGSRHMAKNMKKSDLNLYAVLNFEMLGVSLRSRKYEVFITGYDKSNLADVSNKYAEGPLVGYLPTAKNFGLFRRSDNYPFYQEFGIPSHTYCSFDFTNFNFYHKPGDEVSEMDFEHMATIVNKMIPVVEGITNGPSGELLMN